jgi:hypothetical protein
MVIKLDGDLVNEQKICRALAPRTRLNHFAESPEFVAEITARVLFGGIGPEEPG